MHLISSGMVPSWPRSMRCMILRSCQSYTFRCVPYFPSPTWLISSPDRNDLGRGKSYSLSIFTGKAAVGVLDEPDSAKPAERSSHTGPKGYIGWTLGSSDFPRSLCFMWFWFGLKIPRLVKNKKACLKYWTVNGFYLIWPFNFQKNSNVHYKSWKKKISSKLGAKGIKKGGILRWFQKFVELLQHEFPKIFSQKNAFLENFQSP